MPKKRRKAASTVKTESGGTRRAYGIFRERVTHNVPWSVDALESLLYGDEKRLKNALKFHTNVDIDEGLKITKEPQPRVGDPVEILVEKMTTVVERKKVEVVEEDDFLKKDKKIKEWTSKSFGLPSQKAPPPKVTRVMMSKWVECEVTQISVDKKTYTLREAETGKLLAGIARRRIRPLGRETPLREEPYLQFGGSREATIMPAARYFKSLRLADEDTDGGGVYGRHLQLPTYDPTLLVGTVGDTLIHIIMKNAQLKNRQAVLDIFMGLGSFSEESLKVVNESNRTAMEEMDPPFSLRVPSASYGFALQVRLREVRLALGDKWNRSVERTKIPKYLADLKATPESYDGALARFNTRGVLWEHDLSTGLRKNEGHGSSDFSPLYFVDGGRYRGYIVSHRILEAAQSYWEGGGGGVPEAAEAEEEALVARLHFCVEWEPPPLPSPLWLEREAKESAAPTSPPSQQRPPPKATIRPATAEDDESSSGDTSSGGAGVESAKDEDRPDLTYRGLDVGIRRQHWYRGDDFFREHPVAVRRYLEANPLEETKSKPKPKASDALVERAAAAPKAPRAAKGAMALVVLGPVSHTSNRTAAPGDDEAGQGESDGRVLRPAEERTFLSDWKYEVFDPDCLTGISTIVGGNFKGPQSKARAWFDAELEELRKEMHRRARSTDTLGHTWDR